MSKWAGFGKPMPWETEWHDDILSEQEFWHAFARKHGSLVTLRCFERRSVRRTELDENDEPGETWEFDPAVIFGDLYAETLGDWMVAIGEDERYVAQAIGVEADDMGDENELFLATLVRRKLVEGSIEPKRRERWVEWLYCNARRMWPMPEDYENIPAFMAAHYTNQEKRAAL